MCTFITTLYNSRYIREWLKGREGEEEGEYVLNVQREENIIAMDREECSFCHVFVISRSWHF